MIYYRHLISNQNNARLVEKRKPLGIDFTGLTNIYQNFGLVSLKLKSAVSELQCIALSFTAGCTLCCFSIRIPSN